MQKIIEEEKKIKIQEIIPYDEQILTIGEAKKLPYYKGLVCIKKVLKKNMHTKSCCRIAARLVNLRLGLEELAGIYTTKSYPGRSDNPGSADNRHSWINPHSWNYDAERGLYVDLTQDQFIEALPDIVILPSSTKILTPDAKETDRFKRRMFYKLLDELMIECGN